MSNLFSKSNTPRKSEVVDTAAPPVVLSVLALPLVLSGYRPAFYIWIFWTNFFGHLVCAVFDLTYLKKEHRHFLPSLVIHFFFYAIFILIILLIKLFNPTFFNSAF